MKKQILIVIISLICYTSKAQNKSNAAYPYDPVTQSQKGITAGEIIEKHFSDSKIYPGTKRTYWIYVPAGYTPEDPACLFICMDGILCNAPTVFDNLIDKGEMPVTIGIFVGPGEITSEKNVSLRFNRSNEFDKTDDTFVRFLSEELLPDAEKQKTRDGRPIRISNNSNDRAIAGVSSGAICAFTAAWQRPDQFSRVFSSIGTYVAMRGGNEYSVLIRKTEPKPIRIFLEDGINDTWNPLFGNWYEANLLMESALNFSGYEVEHSWGRGGHDLEHATHIFPDAMRWLWKGWPAKVQSGNSLNDMLSAILIKDSNWEEVSQPYHPSEELFADETGNVIFQNKSETIFKLDTAGNVTQLMSLASNEHLIATDRDQLYITDSKGTITARGTKGKRVIAKGIPYAKCLLEMSEGNIFITQVNADDGASYLWLIKSDGTKRIINRQPTGGNYIAVYPNHKLMMHTEKNSQWIYSYLVDDAGLVKDGQRFYWLHNTENMSLDENRKLTFDENGNMYVASKMGIQVCDQNGRVRAILTLPSGRISSIVFGGKNRDILYAVSDDKLFRRKINARGVESWMSPIEPRSQGPG